MGLNSSDYKILLRWAYGLALKSKDPSTQNAAVLVNDAGGLVLVEGLNSFPEGVLETKERWERPLKYEFVEHAERNVIFQAAREGVKTAGLTMVCPWAACTNCARAIVQSGIKRLVVHRQAIDRSPKFWSETIVIASTILKEGRVEVIVYDGKIGGVPGVRHSGNLWNP